MGNRRRNCTMARVVLDKELQELDAQIVRLGSLVDEALALALEALESGDLAKAGMVIEGDSIIDSLSVAI
jgi:phosphate transport system protein